MMIFVCTPYRASTQEGIEKNMQLAGRICKRVLSENNVPFAPHLFFPHFLNDESQAERNAGIEAGLKVLEKCDAVYVSGNSITEGMAQEIMEAVRLGIPIKYVADPRNAEERLFKEIIKKEM